MKGKEIQMPRRSFQEWLGGPCDARNTQPEAELVLIKMCADMGRFLRSLGRKGKEIAGSIPSTGENRYYLVRKKRD